MNQKAVQFSNTRFIILDMKNNSLKRSDSRSFFRNRPIQKVRRDFAAPRSNSPTLGDIYFIKDPSNNNNDKVLKPYSPLVKKSVIVLRQESRSNSKQVSSQPAQIRRPLLESNPLINLQPLQRESQRISKEKDRRSQVEFQLKKVQEINNSKGQFHPDIQEPQTILDNESKQKIQRKSNMHSSFKSISIDKVRRSFKASSRHLTSFKPSKSEISDRDNSVRSISKSKTKIILPQQTVLVRHNEAVFSHKSLLISREEPTPLAPQNPPPQLQEEFKSQSDRRVKIETKDAQVQAALSRISMPQQIMVNQSQPYFQRAQILRYLNLRKEQSKFCDIYPKFLREIASRFYDGQFQPSAKIFQEGSKEKGIATWVQSFKLRGYQLDKLHLFKKKKKKFSVINDSNYLQNLTAAINFLNLKDQELIFRLFQNPGMIQACGMYSLWLCVHGEFKPIFIDDIIPTTFLGDPYFNHSAKDQVYVMLLQKAIAKSLGLYSLASSIQISQLLKMMTGSPTVSFQFKSRQEGWFDTVKSLLKHQNLVVLTRPTKYFYLTPTVDIEETHMLLEKTGATIKRSIIKTKREIIGRYFFLRQIEQIKQGKVISEVLKLLSSKGQTVNILREQVPQCFQSFSANFIRPDYFYYYESFALFLNQIFSLTFSTKENYLYLGLIQKTSFLPSRISLYRQLIQNNKILLQKFKDIKSKAVVQTFLQCHLNKGTYVIFIQLTSNNTLEKLQTEGYNPLVNISSYEKVNELRDITLTFYSQERLRIEQPDFLQNEGSCLSSKNEYILSMSRKELQKFSFNKDQLQQFILVKNLKFSQMFKNIMEHQKPNEIIDESRDLAIRGAKSIFRAKSKKKKPGEKFKRAVMAKRFQCDESEL